MWDFETGNAIFEYGEAHGESAITCLTFDSTGRRYAYGVQLNAPWLKNEYLFARNVTTIVYVTLEHCVNTDGDFNGWNGF